MALLLIAGLPATGKSRLGTALAQKLDGHAIDKDLLRAALFEPSRVEYTSYQDDFVFSLMRQTAEWLWQSNADLWIVLGGRTFAQRSLRQQVREWAAGHGQRVETIECVCDEGLIRERLLAPHPARNRNWAMWQQLRDRFEPLDGNEPHLRLDTGLPFDRCVSEALIYLKGA